VARQPTGGNTPEPDQTEKASAEDEILMREIDEAVRKDDLEQFGKKYGVPLAGGVAALLLGLGGFVYWDSQNESALEGQSEVLVGAIDQINAGNLAEASVAVAPLTEEASPAARASALFVQASAAIDSGNTAEAVELLARIANDENTPPALRDLALIREVSADFDNREPGDVIAQLAPLAEPDNPFYGSAAELTAMAHLEAGDAAAAGALFADISKADDVPESLRSRARQMAGQLGIDAIDDVNKLLEDQGIEPESTGS